MKKLTLVCIVAMAAFVMTACGNRNAKKAAEVQVIETETVAAEATACCAACPCEECKCGGMQMRRGGCALARSVFAKGAVAPKLRSVRTAHRVRIANARQRSARSANAKIANVLTAVPRP